MPNDTAPRRNPVAMSSGMCRLQRIHRSHEMARRQGLPMAWVLEDLERTGALGVGPRSAPDEVPEAERRIARRGFLAGAGALSAALAARPSRARTARASRHDARVVIVGAGLAGLRCAHALWTSGRGPRIASVVFEAQPDHVGGRCWSLRGYFSDGLIGEHGGEFLDANHRAVRVLAAKLGLGLEGVNAGDVEVGHEVYWFDGYYSLKEANSDWHHVGYRVFSSAAREAGTPSGAAALDAMSVPEWLDSTPIGAGSRLGRLVQASTVTENGGDPSDQSALDLVYILAGNARTSIMPLPGDDEKYHIIGGNDQLVSGMLGQLPKETVRFNHQLVAVRRQNVPPYTLTFSVDGVLTDVPADHVVLALPFSTLKDVDLSKSGLSPEKQQVIATLGMGTNAKIHIEVTRKTWPPLGFSGATYTDYQRFCCAWDGSVPRGPNGAPAILIGFPGANIGKSFLTGAPHGPAPPRDVLWFLGQIDDVFPGTIAAFSGRAYEDHWAVDPWVKGAYSYNRVGQAVSFAAIAARAEGTMHFAGEHTSENNQGFLEGAVETGKRAAREVRRALRG